MKFKRMQIDKLCGRWNRTYNRFDRYIIQETRYQGETIIDGKSYVLELFKLADGWRLGIYGMYFGKDMHFRTIAEAESRAETAFREYLYWQGEENLRRQEYEYQRNSKQPVFEMPG